MDQRRVGGSLEGPPPATPTGVALPPPLVTTGNAATAGGLSLGALLDVLSNAPLATALLGDDLRVLHANAAFVAMATGAAVGGQLAAVLPELADSLVPAATAALIDGTRVDRAVVRSTGRPTELRQYWQLSVFPIDRTAGDRFAVGLFLSDVTADRRAAQRLTDSLARLDLSLAAGGLASWDWDLVTGEIVWSDNSGDSLGLAAEAFEPSPDAFLAVVRPEDRDDHRSRVMAALDAGGDFQNEVRAIGADGEERWVEIRGRVVSHTRGHARRMIGVASDVTDRRLIDEIKARMLEREHRARIDAEEAHRRLAFVAQVSAALTSTLDPQAAYDLIPQLVVPMICDWCVVDILDDDGNLVEAAIAHREPAVVDDVRQLRMRRQESGGDGIWSVRRTIRRGASEMMLDIGDDELVEAAVDEDHLALLRQLAPRSAIVVPLLARGRVLGGLTFVATHDRRFGPDDLTLVENLAARAAMAVDNAMLFQSMTEVTRALQQTLLPPALPSVPNLDVIARYRVAGGGIDIGGDFYDVFRQEDGSWAVVIGDVCGKGPEAAALTGLFRYTLRAVAMAEHSPASVLRATNDAILGRIEDTRFCTAALVGLRTSVGRARATIACGGHPHPVVVRAVGTVEIVEVSGTLLGVVPDPALSEVEVDLGPGDAVVLYTDGVTEARRGDDLFGEAGLLEVLATAVHAGVDTSAGLADSILDAVDRFQDGVANDDTAIVVVRVIDPAAAAST